MRFSATKAALWLALAGLLWALGGQGVGADAPALVGCPPLPLDSIWTARVDHLPILANSDAYIASIGRDRHLHPDFGAGLYEGQSIGIPYCTVSGDQPQGERILACSISGTALFALQAISNAEVAE
jgi:hypothetical protein